MTKARTIGHEIATRAVTQLVEEACEAGLRWEEIALAGESVVAIVVAAAIRSSPARMTDPERFATELVDVITERAHGRVIESLRAEACAA